MADVPTRPHGHSASLRELEAAALERARLREAGEPVPVPAKKGSYTVPSFCKGGKVIKSWSK